MDLNWIRAEVQKNQEDIDWLSIVDISRKIYDIENKKKSVLGLSRGYINFVKVTDYYGNKISDALYLIYPKIKIYKVSTQAQFNKMFKDGILNKKIMSDELVVILSAKSIENVLTRNKIPFFKFIARTINRSYKQPNGSFKRDERISWRKEGEKGFTWSDSLSLRRDNILENLFEE